MNNRTLRVWAAWDKLPSPRDWMLSSFSPLQVEEAVIRAKFATIAPHHHGGEVVQMGSIGTDADASLDGDQSYLIILASPIICHPKYRNQQTSLHLFPGVHYNPHTFRDELQFALHRFLNSPEPITTAPDMNAPADASGLPKDYSPVRMFVIQLVDVCCTSTSGKICVQTLQAVKDLYKHLPGYPRLPYTGSVYVATTKYPGFLDLTCIGYQKRVFFMSQFR